MSHAHLQYAYNTCAKFQIDCFKTLEEVDYTNFFMCDGQTDQWTDGQGHNVMPPSYRHGGIKIQLSKFEDEIKTFRNECFV